MSYYIFLQIYVCFYYVSTILKKCISCPGSLRRHTIALHDAGEDTNVVSFPGVNKYKLLLEWDVLIGFTKSHSALGTSFTFVGFPIWKIQESVTSERRQSQWTELHQTAFFEVQVASWWESWTTSFSGNLRAPWDLKTFNHEVESLWCYRRSIVQYFSHEAEIYLLC